MTAAQREFAGNQVVACLRSAPNLAAVYRLTAAFEDL